MAEMSPAKSIQFVIHANLPDGVFQKSKTRMKPSHRHTFGIRILQELTIIGNRSYVSRSKRCGTFYQTVVGTPKIRTRGVKSNQLCK